MGAILSTFLVAACFAPLLFRFLGRNAFLLLAAVPLTGLMFSIIQAPAVLAGRPPWELYDWLPVLDMSIIFRMDTLSWILSLMVTGVGTLVFVYCARYFSERDPGLGEFAAHLTAFAGMMYGLVLADELLVLFMFWEGTTVFSYLLIGFSSTRQQSRRAALQALVVTTFGGLIMLLGMLMLSHEYGTGRISDITTRGYLEGNVVVAIAMYLILIGAISKSALVPFHFWLPGAMAAPTPVSAYLHAAAMVKAGIFLILRFSPSFYTMPGWVPVLVTVGVGTMLIGAWQALREFDLKLVLAYGTVSQLGFLTAVSAFGTRGVTIAALAMLVSHALFKCTLFLTVGIIDHAVGTRDLRKLSGYGKRDPWLAGVGIVAAASMAGVPPLYGFVAKEAVIETILATQSKVGYIALAGIFLGSVMTVGYAWRFVYGAFATKENIEPVSGHSTSKLLMVPPVFLAVALTVLGPLSFVLNGPFAAYTHDFSGHSYHLALWHGFTPALALSGAIFAVGAVLVYAGPYVSQFQSHMPTIIDFPRAYSRIIQGLVSTAAYVTSRTQRGSMPFYQSVIYAVAIAGMGITLLANNSWGVVPEFAQSWGQVAVAAIIIPAALAATIARKRFQAVLIVGVTGYGMVAFFAMQGAPDLALTQALVETITIVVFILVLRRLPVNMAGDPAKNFSPPVRAIIGASFGILMMVGVVVAMGNRIHTPVSDVWGELAYNVGHGKNIVNVALVDIRAWDTMGELSVVVVAATGIASLIFVQSRERKLPRVEFPSHIPSGLRRFTVPVAEDILPKNSDDTADDTPSNDDQESKRNAWLMAGRTLAPRNRSIMLEVLVRLIFHAMLVISVYLLFAGHNAPGGGFAAGLVAGLAFTVRYLAGGRYELAEAAVFDAGRLLGTGLAIVMLTALGGLLWGEAILQSEYWSATLPVLGELSLGTSTLFDIGVYFVVMGLMLDILRSLGAEVDRHQEADEQRLAEVLAEGDEQADRRKLSAIMGRIDSLRDRIERRGDGL